MPDRRTSRGAHPKDGDCFAAASLPAIRRATDDYCWLLGRGYTPKAALKLVGDRYALRDRQRKALQRAAASDLERAARAERAAPLTALAGSELEIDGYNLLLTCEAALSGGLLLLARDGTLRDLSSLSRHYQRVRQTREALAHVGGFLAGAGAARVRWRLDRPISNSGRLMSLIERVAAEHAWPWEVVLSAHVDRELIESPHLVASADSAILDRCRAWVNLARWVVESRIPDGWIVEL